MNKARRRRPLSHKERLRLAPRVSTAEASPAKIDHVAWATDYHGDGNSFGYAVHNDEARAALVGQGVEIDPESPVALHVAPAHLFRPVQGKLNILYTAWESTDLTPRFREGLKCADAVAVTAKFLVEVIRRELPDKPVGYCPLGVHAEEFRFVDRRAPDAGKPFRFLWVGAPNARKGWEVVLEAWRGFAELAGMGSRVPPAELHVKTTVTGRYEDIPLPGARVVFDSRRLPREELAGLYADAHAFVFPSFGEGFGLTMAEAMSTGLPVLFTPWSAMKDLADESSGYPLRYRLIKHDLAAPPVRPRTEADVPAADGGLPITFAQASAEDLLRRMIEVMSDYKAAVRKGRLAARRIRRKFTWERTGRTLRSLVEAALAKRPRTP